MNFKIIAASLGLIAVVAIAFASFANLNKANKTPYDFGDAPDGTPEGNFPSLLKSNGARAKNTEEIWLGKEVTAENDSKQVNLDEADDGVKLELNSCQKSKGYFFVHTNNFRKSGTAYLNLYADWNKDGKWQGADGCASEWAVQNFPVDLSRQNQEIAVYVPEFTAGKNTDQLWYRSVVSLDQQMNEAATGEFASGEVEDYGPKEPGDEKYYDFYCNPYPLKIKHGDKGDFKILPDLFSEPINKVGFGQNYNPVNDKRNVTIQNNVATYESLEKDIDPPARSDIHFVDLKVSFGAGATEAVLDRSCIVIVEHDEITTETPSEKTPPRRTLPPGKVETATPSPTTKSSPSESEIHPQETTPGLMGF